MAAIKCLVVGLGIGQLYKNVCKDLKYICYTVDINPDLNPNYLDLDQAITDVNSIDIAIVSVPNYLHYSIAKKVAKVSKIVLIEKPGVKDAQEWQSLVREFPNTRFMMIKNNQYRDNTKLLFAKYHKSKNIKLHWINNNRVPKPGSWFTNSQLSYGGVSKDLLPHLLSFYTLFEPQYQQTNWHNKIKTQKWQLQDLTDSDYGDIKVDGIYNVDDYVTLNTNIFNKDITITTDWRSMSGSDIGLYFDNEFIDL
jgi:hypothetical protein